jgi:hypothetical protein
MKNKILAGMAMVGIFVVSTAHADTTYTTSKGAVFGKIRAERFGVLTKVILRITL